VIVGIDEAWFHLVDRDSAESAVESEVMQAGSGPPAVAEKKLRVFRNLAPPILIGWDERCDLPASSKQFPAFGKPAMDLSLATPAERRDRGGDPPIRHQENIS
jgi:hypothetical protein